MTRDRWQHIKSLLHSALERDPSERAAFLNEACAGNPSLQTEVESLITSSEQAGGFIESPAFEVMAGTLANDQAESMVGQTLDRIRFSSSSERAEWGKFIWRKTLVWDARSR